MKRAELGAVLKELRKYICLVSLLCFQKLVFFFFFILLARGYGA